MPGPVLDVVFPLFHINLPASCILQIKKLRLDEGDGEACPGSYGQEMNGPKPTLCLFHDSKTLAQRNTNFYKDPKGTAFYPEVISDLPSFF